MTNGNAPRRKISSVRPPWHGRVSRTSNNSQDTFEEIPLKTSRTGDMCSSLMKKVFRTKRKKILKGISVYFNPGEMVGIMGPSGKIFKIKTFYRYMMQTFLIFRMWQDNFPRYFNWQTQKWDIFRKFLFPKILPYPYKNFLCPSKIHLSGSNFHQWSPTGGKSGVVYQ